MINFYVELGSVADWIVVSLTFIGVGIAGYGLYFARKTVHNWKKEKEWEVVLEAKAYAKTALDYVIFSHGPSKYILQFKDEKNIIRKKNHEISLLNELLEKEDRFKNAYQTSMLILEKLKATFQPKSNDVIDFYQDIINKLDMLDSNNQRIRLLEAAIDYEEKRIPISEERINEFRGRIQVLLNKVGSFPRDKISDLNIKLQKLKDYGIISKKQPRKWWVKKSPRFLRGFQNKQQL